MQITEAATAPVNIDGGDIRIGTQDSRVMLVGREGSLNNFKLTLSTATTEWVAPRHRHDFDQVRFPIKGEFVYADDKILPEGSVAYFPEGVHYGPQIRRVGLLMVLVQFGSASQNSYLSRPQRKIVLEEMRAKGSFGDGAYTWYDEQGNRHRQDASEAVLQHARKGKKVVYPPKRYGDIITMTPENFTWIESRETPGLAFKWLGTFTEREWRVGFIRIKQGATLKAGVHPAPECLFMVSGAVKCRGRTYGPHTAIGFEGMEGPEPLEATEDTEFFCIQLPKFEDDRYVLEDDLNAEEKAMAPAE